MSIEALQRTRPRLRFLLNLNSSGWGCAAEGEALSCSIHHSSVFLRPCR